MYLLLYLSPSLPRFLSLPLSIPLFFLLSFSIMLYKYSLLHLQILILLYPNHQSIDCNYCIDYLLSFNAIVINQ